jgi:hypothetical protein
MPRPYSHSAFGAQPKTRSVTMSGLSVPGFQSATGATAAIYAQIKKTVGNVPNTFAAIGGHGSAAVKAVPAAGGVPYLHIIVERSTRYAAVVAAGLVLFGLLAPTAVTARQRASVATDLSVSATATDGTSHAVAAKPGRNGTTPLTSHLPWLAPVGHRQPRSSDVPQDEASAARVRHQFRLDNELDRKLIICRCS